VIEGVQLGMCEVITNAKLGTANWVFTGWDHARVKVCGKTGTVQSGTLYPHGWFVAYAGLPNQKPDIAIAVLVLYSREGSETGAPIARRIIEAYYGLPYAPFPSYWADPYEVLPTPGLSGGQ
jgi:penicillin-binding protein 2